MQQNPNAGYPASNAFDGNLTTTRWSSQFSDAQWLYVDLGKRYDLCKVILFWEAAYGKDFDIQTSDDALTWKTIYQARNNTSTLSIMPLQGSGRYVKMNGIHRSTSYGYSILEMQVYGSASITCQAPTNLAASNLQQNSATISWNAVSGATVSFSAPAQTGASATFGTSSGTTNASGQFTTTVTANTHAGSYQVTATDVGVGTANYSLTNTAGAATTVTRRASASRLNSSRRATTPGAT